MINKESTEYDGENSREDSLRTEREGLEMFGEKNRTPSLWKNHTQPYLDKIKPRTYE
tara:strand:- start:2555 stop:2725 length:171 start_codon:yes stop_codon:yes gene_type:complete